MRRSKHQRTPHGLTCVGARGFTMIEVMVALVVTAIGLLGIAKMQSLAFASTGTASVRSVITIEAASLASLMRANRSYWGAAGPNVWAGATPNTIVITNSNLAGAPAVLIDDATLNTAAATATFTNNLCASGGASAPCNSALLAGNDLHIWADGLFNLLPKLAITTSINCPIVTPVNCVITMTWTEKTVAINGQGQGALNTAISAPQYILYVQP